LQWMIITALSAIALVTLLALLWQAFSVLHRLELLVACRYALPTFDVLAYCGHRISHRPSDLNEARSGAIHPRLGQPLRRDAEEFGDVRGVQERIELISFGGGFHGPPHLSCCAH